MGKNSDQSMKKFDDAMEFCERYIPKWRGEILLSETQKKELKKNWRRKALVIFLISSTPKR